MWQARTRRIHHQLKMALLPFIFQSLSCGYFLVLLATCNLSRASFQCTHQSLPSPLKKLWLLRWLPTLRLAPRILEPALLYLFPTALTPPTPSFFPSLTVQPGATHTCLRYWSLDPPPYPPCEQHTVAISPLSRLVRSPWGMLPRDLCWGPCPPPVCKVESPFHRASLFWNWTDSLCVM